MKNIFILAFTINALVLNAQTSRKYSNEFLNIGVDARAMAMGNSVVAHTDNVNAGYWNPAGLNNVETIEVAAMHAEYFAGIAKYDYAAVALPLDNKNTLGVSLIRFGVDDILNTTELIDANGNIDYDRISKFSTADYALTASYAGKLFNIEGLSVGANAKIVYRHIGEFANSIGFGLDAGAQYKTKNNFLLGLMVRDITTTFNSWKINEDKLTTNFNGVNLNELPDESQLELTLPKMQLGAAKKFYFGADNKFGLLAELDLNMRFAETNAIISSSFVSIDPTFGFEGSFKDMVFIRAGVNNFGKQIIFEKEETTFQPNFGAGFKYRNFALDYALTNIGSTNGTLYSNVFSLRYTFN